MSDKPSKPSKQSVQVRKVDVAIIGAGTAGLNARREVEKRGGKALLIESGPYGTTCARVGCMPSKLMIAAADIAHEVSAAGRFGVLINEGWSIDGPAVLERVRRERDRFAGFVVKATEALPEEQRLRGHARFIGPTTLQVDDHTRVEARAVVVAAGSTPVRPAPFDKLDRHVMVNDDVFELADLPASVAVIGTGIIGLELGQALSRLGVRTMLFNHSDNLGPFTDPEVRKIVREVLGAELNLQLQSRVLDAKADGNGVVIRWRDAAGAEHEERFAKVLAAAGRRSNLTNMDFAATGLALGGNGFPQWNPHTAQCGDAPIFLAGDVSNHRALLHEAADEGRIAGANAMLYPKLSEHERRTPLAIAFTDPQIALVGKRYADLDHDAIEIGDVSFADQGRARVIGKNRGLVRIYADRQCCELIGAEMFGPSVEHMAHLLAWAVQQRLRVQKTLEMPFYHPVVEEGLRTALRDLAERLKVTGECRSEDLAEAPGV